MKDYSYLKPIYRSKIRLFFGSRYYRMRRYFHWYFSSISYASEQRDDQLEHLIVNHKTPMLRKLKDVDMWLQHNKAVNLNIAIKRINGIIVRPGETFSYWKLIGKPSYDKGYKDGMILYYGEFRSGVGGGLCQLSNLIYWMTLHTPLTVTERYRHSFDVFPDCSRTQPFGSGATCVYNYRDLCFKNETNETYQINLWIEDDYLFGEIVSDAPQYFLYEIYESNHMITHEYWGRYIRHNEIRRQVFDLENNKKGDLFVCENHALMMYEPYIETKGYDSSGP